MSTLFDFLINFLNPNTALLLLILFELYKLKVELAKMKETLKWVEWLVKKWCNNDDSCKR